MNATMPSAADAVAALVRPEIRALTAYPVAKAGNLVKLDANESPFPLPDALRGKIAAALADVPVHRYPDGGADAVAAALRATLRLPDHLGLILGNGSDELIQLIVLALARTEAVALAPEPTFVMYRLSALYAGMRYVGVPLAADFTLDIDAMLAAIERERPAVVFLATPNNPTGNAHAHADIERILRATPGLVVVDEAYTAYAAGSFLSRAGEFPNLLVLRTLSKIGMAALRLGYAVAAPEWTAELNKLRPPYNLNALTQAAATVLLGEGEWLAKQAAMVRAERVRLTAALSALPQVVVFPSEANFMLLRVRDAGGWSGALRAAGFLVKNLHGGHPALAQCLRLTVGTPDENDALIATLKTMP